MIDHQLTPKMLTEAPQQCQGGTSNNSNPDFSAWQRRLLHSICILSASEAGTAFCKLQAHGTVRGSGFE